MGWRSWNLYDENIDETLMIKAMDGLASRKRQVDGVPTSLADLGYRDVGLDDAWQLCGSYGDEEFTYHASDGLYPVVNRSRFSDMEALTNYAHALNLTAGWYLNNCICSDHCGIRDDLEETDDRCYRGDAAALFSFGFDSVKLDGCGAQRSLDLWASLLQGIVIENCHWGETIPNATWCPFHFYRSSGDIRPNFASVLANLETIFPFAVQNLSKPGCWAYPDALEVGIERISASLYHAKGEPRRAGSEALTFTETQSHFAAWAIVSSPLILSMDPNNDNIMDELWPLIANPDIIDVNQAYFGFSGGRYHHSSGAYQLLYKPLDPTSTAVLVMNTHDHQPLSINLTFADVPDLPCSSSSVGCLVRDLFSRTNLGFFTTSFPVESIPPHGSAFLRLSSSSPNTSSLQ